MIYEEAESWFSLCRAMCTIGDSIVPMTRRQIALQFTTKVSWFRYFNNAEFGLVYFLQSYTISHDQVHIINLEMGEWGKLNTDPISTWFLISLQLISKWLLYLLFNIDVDKLFHCHFYNFTSITSNPSTSTSYHTNYKLDSLPAAGKKPTCWYQPPDPRTKIKQDPLGLFLKHWAGIRAKCFHINLRLHHGKVFHLVIFLVWFSF